MKLRSGFTIVEVIISICLFILILSAFYRLFFSEVRSIRSALEHLGVNENARRFMAQFGNDVRNANVLLFPVPTVREAVPKLMPMTDGLVCRLERQLFDWDIKPPDPALIKTETIEYKLVKEKNGVSSLYRESESEIPPFPGASVPFRSRRKICGGIREMLVFASIRRPVTLGTFGGLPFKNLLVYESYEVDGHGPRLIHVRMVLVRESLQRPPTAQEVALPIQTCFAIRGQLNGVNP